MIRDAIALEYGRGELLRRLAHPFWFQPLGAVMGLDWRSSGTTTSATRTVQRSPKSLSAEFCGGRDDHLREMPHKLRLQTSGYFRRIPSTNTSTRRSTLLCQPGLSCV
jgi:hypothetical protein